MCEQPERHRERERGMWRWVAARWNHPSTCRGAGARRRAAPRTAGSIPRRLLSRQVNTAVHGDPWGPRDGGVRPTAEEAALGFGAEAGSGEEPHGS